MNLFVTSPDPAACAQALDDRRLVKAVLETAQLLSTAGYGSYRPTHVNHPVTKWVCATPVNTVWTYRHLCDLAAEYGWRYSNKTHASMYAVDIERLTELALSIGAAAPASWQNSARNATLNLDFTHLPVFEAYRAYLSAKWRADGAKARWTNRQPPEWRQL